jgi:hypothetical protein
VKFLPNAGSVIGVVEQLMARVEGKLDLIGIEGGAAGRHPAIHISSNSCLDH